MRSCCAVAKTVSGPPGPQGPFNSSAYFKMELVSDDDLPIAPSPGSTVVPLQTVLVNQGGGLADATNYWYVVPATGPYHFDFNAVLSDAGTGPALNAQVTLALELGSIALAVPQVQVLAFKTSFSGVREEQKAIAGRATLELAAGQTVRLTLKNEAGNNTSFIANSTNFPGGTFLSGFALF